MYSRPGEDEEAKEPLTDRQRAVLEFISQIGRASCRERV